MTDKLKKNSWMNSLLGDELIAAIQYFIAMQVCIGEGQQSLRDHFEEHYKEELEHFQWLSEAMLERGLIVNYDLKSLIEKAFSGYATITSNDSVYLTKFFSAREKEAVQAYESFHQLIKDTDPSLDDTIISIINQESDHKLDMDRRLHDSTLVVETPEQQKLAGSVKRSSIIGKDLIKLFADKGKETRRNVAKGLVRNPGAVLNDLLKANKVPESAKGELSFSFLINFNEDWSDKVQTSWVPPEGLFTRSAKEIVEVLKEQSTDKSQAMSRLNFYINRAGSNLSNERKSELELAKNLLSQTQFSKSLYDELFN